MNADSRDVLDRFESSLALVDSAARALFAALGGAVDVSVHFEDLVSVGRLGLLEAARRFEPERGVQFRTYATYRVRGAMLDVLRKVPRLPLATLRRVHALEAANAASEGETEAVGATRDRFPGDASATLDEHLDNLALALELGLAGADPAGAPGAESNPEATAERNELMAMLGEALARGREDEGEVLRRYYFESQSFRDIAADLGISHPWVCRLHARAIARLGRWFRGRT